MWIAFLILLLIAAACVFYLYKVLRRSLRAFSVSTDKMWIRVVLWAAASLMGLCLLDLSSIGFMLVVHFMAFSALAQLIAWIVKKLTSDRLFTVRKVLHCGVLPLLAAVGVVVYGYFNMYRVVCTDYTLKTHKAIPQEGYRVALIADVHYGVTLDEGELLQVCQRVSGEKPDVVILCGDIVDNETTEKGLQTVFSALGSIESTYGVYYVYGNHDRPMSAVKSPFTEEQLVRAIEDAGITVLQDEAVCLEETLSLAGRDDPVFGGRGERLTAQQLLAGIPENAYCIVANHQPADYIATGKAGADLILSGHTHGGQIWPANWIDSIFRFNDANYGLVSVDTDSKAIVTSGLAGWGFPIKTSAPSEYVMIQILPESD